MRARKRKGGQLKHGAFPRIRGKEEGGFPGSVQASPEKRHCAAQLYSILATVPEDVVSGERRQARQLTGSTYCMLCTVVCSRGFVLNSTHSPGERDRGKEER